VTWDTNYTYLLSADSKIKCAAAHLIYVTVTPQDVYQQYARAVAQHIRPLPVTTS